ncbi:MAG: PEP-CTERM sorting domain-containing protein, partial [Thiobacillus sp.]
AHVAPFQADHDGADATVAYLASLPGVPKEGAFRAMNDWRITNDAGDPFSVFTYMGSAFDADMNGTASGSFFLPAGDYSVFVGGVNYVAQIGAMAPYPRYGLKVTLDVAAAPVPEAGAYAMLLAGLGLVGWVTARRRQS